MPIEARLESHLNADRRRGGRRELRLWLDMRHGSDETSDALVLNISESGLLFQTAAPPAAGDTLQVDLPEAGLRAASVVWTSGQFVGCRFERPLSPAIVSAAQLRSEPHAAQPFGSSDEAAPAPEGFGSRLRRLRKQSGLTQPALARLVDVTKLTVWKWERGDARPRHGALQALARVFAISESELLLGSPTRDNGVEQSSELAAIVDDCKARIADCVGTSTDKIEIAIRL